MPDPIVNLRAERHVPVAVPRLDHGEEHAVADCVRRGWISQGPKVAEFEREFAAAHDKRHGVACHSGTAALNLALVAAGIGNGDRVVCPSLTMVAVPNAIRYVGALPVFVDSDPSDGNMDVQATLHAIEQMKARAVIVPHLYGVPSEATAAILREFKGINQPVIVEDCAEAHYARTPDGAPVGFSSDLATFSFYANKIITTGEGGMVLTNDEQMADRLCSLRSHAFSPETHFTHTGLAFGDRMTDLQASVGLVQHAHRHELLRRRDAIAKRYAANLGDMRSPDVPGVTNHAIAGMVWWVFPMVVKDIMNRDKLREHLAGDGIETRTYFVPMHRQAHLKQYAFGQSFPVADDLADRGLYLPLHCCMTDDDVDYICDSARRFFK